MGKKLFLKKENLGKLFDAWKEKYAIFLPYLKGETVVFMPYDEKRDPFFKIPANISPKMVLFPQSERLFSFYVKKEEGKKRVEVKGEIEAKETIIFGSRPCDAKGLITFDKVFLSDEPKDPYFLEKRKNTLIFTMACAFPTSSCFCTSVGSAPDDKEGSDVMMTEFEEGIYMEILRERAEDYLLTDLFEDGTKFEERAKEKAEKVKSFIKKPFDSKALKIDLGVFESDDFWRETVSKCLSCGLCTYLCPTCYCFNITDEAGFDSGERIRSWDSCMFFHYTLEASGHNPRPTKFDRFKNRVGHKFLYFPERYNGIIACCGCGRCIRFCPVSVDISEIVAKLAAKGVE